MDDKEKDETKENGTVLSFPHVISNVMKVYVVFMSYAHNQVLLI